MKDKLINFSKGIGTILLFYILNIIISLILAKYYTSSNMIIANITQLGTYLLLFIVLTWIYKERLKNDIKSFKKEYLNIAFKYWIIGIGAMIIANIIISNFISSLPVNESLNRTMLIKYPIPNLISMIILGPIVEEITFRASFKKAFNKWYTFAIFTAFLFGLAHIARFDLLEFLFIIPYGTLGFFFAKAFYETDNIITSILMHSFHNTISIILIFLLR